MPSTWHDTVQEAVRRDPALALQLPRGAGLDLPAGVPARLESRGFSNRISHEFAADVVVSSGLGGETNCAVITEVEGEGTRGKLEQCPRYAVATWLALRCDVYVVVVCRTDSEVRFYRKNDPITRTAGNLDLRLQLVVLGPEHTPVVTDAAVVVANPELAAWSVSVHGENPAVTEAFRLGLRLLPKKQAGYYNEKAHDLSGVQVQGILEQVMKNEKWIVSTPFAKEHFGQGVAVGEARGEAKAVLKVLQARGLRVTAAQRERITGCTDLDQLENWVGGAVDAPTTGALLRGEPLLAAGRGGSRQRTRAGQRQPRQ